MAKSATGRFAPAVRAIREQISTGEPPPGQWLPSVAQLMTQYGITRYSATEAIKKLASEGLIDIVDGSNHPRARRHPAAGAAAAGCAAKTAGSLTCCWRPSAGNHAQLGGDRPVPVTGRLGQQRSADGVQRVGPLRHVLGAAGCAGRPYGPSGFASRRPVWPTRLTRCWAPPCPPARR